MDWSPQIIVKAEDAQSVPTSVTALKTFDTGFPDTKATVHCIGSYALDFCKQWAAKGGHKLINHVVTTEKSQLHYEIVKRTRLPVALIAGTTVFYEDMSDYSTTKLFGADIIPAINLTDNIINIESVEKTVIFVAQPIKVLSKLHEIMLPVTSSIATEGKNSHVWGNQTVVMCGKIYKQTSGIFNILYNYDKSYMTNFSSKTANKYETVFGGTCITKAMGKYEAAGADTSTLMPYVNAAMNEDWDGVKGYRKTVLDSIK
tara:strand:+ start:2772 stop:3548 length:777 start_codon:yes stop_codon:yes gene_type:complete